MKIEDKFSLYLKWLRVYHFMEFLLAEDYIEDETFHSMTDALLSLKQFVVDEDE
jgi:hypothetical protein